MKKPFPFICPVCSAEVPIPEYVPDNATLYIRCPACTRKLKITPELVEIDDEE
jgi:DNA-directed RNA polymerase subunit RPC12/RpoP